MLHAKPAKPPPLDMYKRMRCVELVFRYGSNPTTVYL